MLTIRPVKIADLPKSRVGKVGTESVSIGDNGQIRFSTKLDAKLQGAEYVAAGWVDQDERTYGFQVVTDPSSFIKTMIKAKLVPADAKGEDYLIKLLRGKEGSLNPYFAGTQLLKLDVEDYDYANSGNQSFEASYDEKTKLITFTMPVGTLQKRETGAGRPKGSKNKDKASGAAAGASNGSPAPVVDLQEAE